MCELFGLSCTEKERATISLPVFGDYSDINKDGWGVGYYEGNRAIIRKKPERARLSSEFQEVIREAKSNIIIAHLRLRTNGEICERNCHPFKVNFLNKDWIFAHNGDVSGIEKHPRAEGETDSEQVFLFMIDKIKEYYNRRAIRGLYPGLMKAIKWIFDRYGTAVHLNFLLSDGNLLYIYHHYPLKPMYLLRREKDYGGAILISTQRLSNEDWLAIPKDRILTLSKGGYFGVIRPIIVNDTEKPPGRNFRNNSDEAAT